MYIYQKNEMGILDIVLGFLLLLAFVKGFKKGLFVCLASLIGLVLGIFGAVYFSDFAAGYLSQWFSWSQQITQIVSFVVTFLGIVFIISISGEFLTKVADFAFLGIFNKILGGVFNTLKIAFIISALFMFINEWRGSGYIISEEKKENSIIYPYIESLAPLVLPYIIKEEKESEK